MKLQLPDQEARNFTVGKVIVFGGDGRRLTGWRLRAYYVRCWLLDITRWWRPRDVTVAVDVGLGSITIERQRWSWRRWRWERS